MHMSPEEQIALDEVVEELGKSEIPTDPAEARVQLAQAEVIIEALQLRAESLKKVANARRRDWRKPDERIA